MVVVVVTVQYASSLKAEQVTAAGELDGERIKAIVSDGGLVVVLICCFYGVVSGGGRMSEAARAYQSSPKKRLEVFADGS